MMVFDSPGGYANARRVTELLLRLSTSSRQITELFERYAVNGQMGTEEWLSFVRTEQHETTTRQSAFAHAGVSELHADPVFDKLQFTLLLLRPQNDAVVAVRRNGTTEGVPNPKDFQVDEKRPLTHYWTACSHNSYIVGDQLTGLSSADACASRRLDATTAELWHCPAPYALLCSR